LGDDRAKGLAAQLPPEIAQYLSHEQGEAGNAFALSEFVDHIYQRGVLCAASKSPLWCIM
jgi:uncharacterized protein (DUF2267 family)